MAVQQMQYMISPKRICTYSGKSKRVCTSESPEGILKTKPLAIIGSLIYFGKFYRVLYQTLSFVHIHRCFYLHRALLRKHRSGISYTQCYHTFKVKFNPFCTNRQISIKSSISREPHFMEFIGSYQNI